MATYLERYQSGEHERVWAELLALKGRVREDRYYADAWAVVEETMRRARHNVEVLIPRLTEIGYKFGDQPGKRRHLSGWNIFEASTPEIPAMHAKWEAAVGPLPLAYRGWNEFVGSVSLCGYHPDWPDPYKLDALQVDSIGMTLEGAPAGQTMFSYWFQLLEEWKYDCREYGEEKTGPLTLDISLDDVMKGGYGGGTYMMAVPCKNVDAPLLRERHKTTFVNYLRISFRWGGFPGFELVPEAERPVEQLAYLTDGLLEI